jgi:L-asparagine transporter-like permease
MKQISFSLRARDYVGSAAGFMTVLTFLVMYDQRVGPKLTAMATHGPSIEMGPLPGWGREFAAALLDVAKDQSIEHAPLLVFTVVAILLVGAMLRT